ncbi:MAG: ribbon-helix-helix protein, CopG family, partial [Desulfohalobiaceae bacterium]
LSLSGSPQSKRKNCMKNIAKQNQLSADEIAEKAMNGEDISSFFTNKGEMKPSIQRVNVDFSIDMLKELDDLARELNISRQALIKVYLRQSLDQHYLARKASP